MKRNLGFIRRSGPSSFSGNNFEGAPASFLLVLLILIDQTPVSVTGWVPFPRLLDGVSPKRPPPPSSIRRRSIPPARLSSSSSGSSSSRVKEDTPEVDVDLLRTENSLLRETVRNLEEENQRLRLQRRGSVGRIVLETFEGERFLRGESSNRFLGRHGDAAASASASSPSTGGGITLSGDEQLSTPGAAGAVMAAAVSTTSPSYEEEEMLWCDELGDGDQCPLEPTISFGGALRDRSYWLVGLLIMQSLSGVILSRNEALLADHPVIIYYLTMMVGAGECMPCWGVIERFRPAIARLGGADRVHSLAPAAPPPCQVEMLEIKRA